MKQPLTPASQEDQVIFVNKGSRNSDLPGPDANMQVTSANEDGTIVLAEQGSWCYVGTGAQENANRKNAEDAFDQMFKKNAAGR